MRNWLKSLRKERGLTQADAARALGLAQNYYSMIESGRRMKDLPLDLAQKLAEVFNISLEQISALESSKAKGD